MFWQNVTTQAQLLYLGVQGNLTAWFCIATLITRLCFVLFRIVWLLRFTLPKARSVNERSAQHHGHWFAFPKLHGFVLPP
jgi:hypothetical protein